MPKIIDYPRASLKRSLDLAQAVEKLGGDCSAESAADGIGNKVSGAFHALVGGAVKYGLISSKGGRISTEPLFRDYRLAYDEREKKDVLRRALLNVPLFKSVSERFDGKKLPEALFEKLLVREFQVPEDLASRVAGYYTEGIRLAGLISESGLISLSIQSDSNSDANPISAEPVLPPQAFVTPPQISSAIQQYRVRISGPDIDSTIEIADESDLAIVNAMLSKIKRRLKIDEQT